MAEFVNKDYLIKWIKSRKRLSKMETILFIQDAPTTCLREVVRCKDCKHFNMRRMECENECISTDNEGGADFSINFKADDFCSYGERREGE